MVTALKIVVAVVAAAVVGTALQSNTPGRTFLGIVFLVTIVYLIAVAAGSGTIIRRPDGRYTNRLEDLEEDEVKKHERPHF